MFMLTYMFEGQRSLSKCASGGEVLVAAYIGADWPQKRKTSEPENPFCDERCKVHQGTL